MAWEEEAPACAKRHNIEVDSWIAPTKEVKYCSPDDKIANCQSPVLVNCGGWANRRLMDGHGRSARERAHVCSSVEDALKRNPPGNYPVLIGA